MIKYNGNNFLPGLTALSSENRFSIRAPFNETLYVATESSTTKHGTLFGAARPFNMHLLDKTNQEALVIRRNMACGLMCCTCVPQNVEVWLPPGDLIGVRRGWKGPKAITLICSLAVRPRSVLILWSGIHHPGFKSGLDLSNRGATITDKVPS